MQNLKELLNALPEHKIRGTVDLRIGGINFDSRKVKTGDLFVAVKGLGSDGHSYIDQAIKNGAVAIVGEKKLNLGVTYIEVTDSREALGKIASKFYKNPSSKLKVIGVTGTKGKTTTCHLIYHILKNLGKKVGLISSIAAKINDREIDTGFHVTSPDVIHLHKFLSDMVKAGCEYAVIEVSSHGIDQKRIAGVNFTVGVLTNIAPEHLDYHKTFKEYKKVKMSFINSCRYKVISPSETDLEILPGKFNNLNIETAIKTVQFLNISKDEALEAVKSFELPSGRLEEIKNNKGIKIYVDFAHTPDSLEAVLTYLKIKNKGRLISVFGCAGERDRKKRFKMGKISAKLADFSVFTAEDPRGENLNDILAKMAKGAKSSGAVEGEDFVRIPERGEAIAYALSIAKAGDTVGFFGKGHEKSLAYAGFEHPWSDQEAIKNYLNKSNNISAIILAAGKGTRMRSDYPKVLSEICGRPVISYTLENLRKSGVGEIIVVVSFRKNLVIKEIGGGLKTATQKNPKGGTGQATKYGLERVDPLSRYVLVFYGDDSAFFRPETTQDVIAEHIKNKATVSFVSVIVKNPFALGRVIRNKNKLVLGIVEEKSANEEQKKINEINCGHFVFNKDWLKKNINKLQKSASGEYYINNLIQAAIDQKEKVMAYRLKDPSEWQGINTPEELTEAQKKMEKRLNSKSVTQ